MPSSGLVILLAFFVRWCRGQSESTTEPQTTTVLARSEQDEAKDTYIDMEIIAIKVLPKLGNVVELSWGYPLKEYNLDRTYGVYYGTALEEALKAPKLTTKDLSADVGNLTFCTLYSFAVGAINPDESPPHPSSNVRTIATLIDEQSAPESLHVEFIPDEQPCLLMKWSASCPTIALPLGYSVTVSEKGTARMTIITVPRTTSVDRSATLRVEYGKTYDVKVSCDVINAKPSDVVSFKVPHFLQPYKVRLTSQPQDGTFVMYWREPYVPYHVGPYYYEVYVYPGRGVSGEHQVYATGKTVFVHRGNESAYTFMVALRSDDGVFESLPTEPMVKGLHEEAFVLEID